MLYGPPASGKDTITKQLQELDPRFLLHRRMKVGSGNSAGYRMGSAEQLQAARAAGRVLYENSRYGNTYAFVSGQLEEDLALGIPVLHVGQVTGVRALKAYPIRWVTVALWCSREESEARARARGSQDVQARLRAWEETRVDFEGAEGEFELVVDTGAVGVEAAARRLLSLVAG